MRQALLRTTVTALLVGAMLLLARPAGAVDNPQYTVPPPSSTVSTPTSRSATKVETAVRVRPVRSRLAITGSDTAQTALLGSGLVVAGIGVLVLRRRHAASA